MCNEAKEEILNGCFVMYITDAAENRLCGKSSLKIYS
jgi:hypothetical protein